MIQTALHLCYLVLCNLKFSFKKGMLLIALFFDWNVYNHFSCVCEHVYRYYFVWSTYELRWKSENSSRIHFSGALSFVSWDKKKNFPYLEFASQLTWIMNARDPSHLSLLISALGLQGAITLFFFLSGLLTSNLGPPSFK